MDLIFRHPKRVGLGLKLANDLKVLEVVRGGPCDSKLQIGDVMIQVDSVKVEGKLPQHIIQYTSGVEGSSATLHFKRGHESKFQKVTRKFEAVENLLQSIKLQVKKGMPRRHDKTVQEVFDKYAVSIGDDGRKCIPKDSLIAGLKEFDVAGVDLLDEDVQRVDDLFKSLDRNKDGILDFEEFKIAVQQPSALEDWARSLNLNQLLADAIPRFPGQDPLRAASELTAEDITCVVEAFSDGLKSILTEHIAKLLEILKKLDTTYVDRPSAIKFETDVPKMNCGSLEQFHQGLSARIGNPHLDFENAMEMEHCQRDGFDLEFVTPNYKLQTRPRDEWLIVIGKQECPPEQMKDGRQIPKIDELLGVDIVLESKMTRHEVIAVVLYTGPMFYVYNTILRRYPVDFYDKLKAEYNFYPTTIFVLVSALQKLSRVTRIEPGMKVYRGLKGEVDLPDLFFTCDQYGCTGFAEWGFMSTTSKMEVALRYSGVHEGGRKPRVLVIEVGSVDKGACVQKLSQYAGELEYLYPPCSFVQGKAGLLSLEVTPSGLVEMIPVKVNVNLKTKTVEGLVEQKKDMHIAAFSYHVDAIHRELRAIAEGKGQNRLKADKSADHHTVEGFLSRIVGQCKDVLSRHKAINSMDFVNDRLFRSLVLEMIEVKEMAISKLQEWLENDSGSFIRYRWNADLRTVHRRWISYLTDKKLETTLSEDERTARAVQLCKALGLIIESVDEKNELGETRLMSAAAEGLSKKFLRLLVEAKASVMQARPDGVTPMWLAAESGHNQAIRTLAKLNADVSQAANDGATPVFIAARNGRAESIDVLVEFKADVNQANKRKVHPLHQAALYGNSSCVDALVKHKADINVLDGKGFSPLETARAAGHEDCAKFIETLGGKEGVLTPMSRGRVRKLIISTGDISDIDGFFALAEYAKEGADVLFVMNYPAYVGVAEADVDLNYEQKNPGLGYKYSAKEVLENAPNPAPPHYTQFLARYPQRSPNDLMKCAMTDLAFEMANAVWDEGPRHGNLMFCIGGINSINPFCHLAIKNEVLIYSGVIPNPQHTLSTEQGTTYGSDGEPCEVNWDQYSEIYMDFNGSLAFWNGLWAHQLSDLVREGKSRIQGVFVMGGVYAEQPPVTLPSIPNVLNRFSSATMNQLYHPQNAANFFAFLEQFNIHAFTVANNVVGDLTTFDDGDPPQKNFKGVDAFLASNGLTGPMLRRLTYAHYGSFYKPGRKPFDYYTAVALKELLTSPIENDPEKRYWGHCTSPSNQRRTAQLRQSKCSRIKEKRVFYSNVYGITFISESDSWEATRAAYAKAVAEINSVSAQKTTQEYFTRELELMGQIDYLASLPVLDLSMTLDVETKKLTL